MNNIEEILIHVFLRHTAFILANVYKCSGSVYELFSSACLMIVAGFTYEVPIDIDSETQLLDLAVLI